MRCILHQASRYRRAATWLVLVASTFGCGPSQAPKPASARAEMPRTADSGPQARPDTTPHTAPDATQCAPATPHVAADAQAEPTTEQPCPPDMIHVSHDFCPELERRCTKSEFDKPNRITICHAFEAGSNVCSSERRRVDVCIDSYEYPNQAGGHPPVMVDFFAAEQSCQAQGKRLCRESEWIAACEGPAEKPFPYGWQRSSEQCNIDNRWIEPNLGRVYSKDARIRERELERLDQSVPSGARAGCVSDFGVHDLTGNFDEWVRLDEPRPKARSKMAGLKGGAWGHVRNACRPVTTSHAPEFTYYFISFRCCRDPLTSESQPPMSQPDPR